MSPAVDSPEAKSKRGLSRRGKIAAGVLIAVGLLAALFLLLRFGVLSPQSRLLIEARTDGLEIGRFGELKIEGLRGDVFSDFTIRRLTLADEKGVWLEARRIRVDWSYAQLLRRRFQADEITAEHVRILRRPLLTPKTESRGLPVSFDIDAFRARLEMMPAFSSRHGVYDLAGALEVGRRNTGQEGRVTANSVLHPGDRLELAFVFGGGRPLFVDGDAREAQGGALAGALGLPADQPFLLRLDARERDEVTSFSGLARSGEATPLTLQGRWTPQGGRVNGRLSLTDSTLTAPIAERIGPEVRFGLTGSDLRGELMALQVTAASPQASLSAAGRADLQERRTGPQGIQLTVRLAPAADILPGPDIGETRLSGRLTGSLQDWRFAGDLAAQQLALAEYGLSRIAGPVVVAGDGGGISLRTELAGQGGRGDGLAAALLGANPRVQVEAARLSDGRFVFEDIEARGAGLTVDATGGRSLLGRLTFRGQAEISNLQAIRPGAGGAVRLDWRAAQGGPGSPWGIDFSAAGRRISTGFDELDTLLGPRPRLTADARLGGGQIAINRARLDGADLNATAAGLIGGPQGLRLNVDWRADGPFTVGPLEITGDARGSGALSGQPGSPTLDLTARFDTVDVPRLPLRDARLTLRLAPRRAGPAGAFALTAETPYGPARARADLAFPSGGLRLSDLSVDAGGVQATGSVAVRQGQPAAANLNVRVGPGAVLSQGRLAGSVRIVDTRASPSVTLNLTARNAALRGSDVTVRSGRLTASGPLSRLPYEIAASGASGRGRYRLDGSGLIMGEQPGYALTFSGSGALAGETVRTTEPAVLRWRGETRTARVRLATERGGTVSADARLTAATAEIEAKVANVSLALLNADLAGRVNARAALQGRGGRLTGNVDARLVDARARGSERSLGLDAVLRGRLADDVLRFEATASNQQGLRAQAQGALPTEASADPLRLAIARRRPISGTFSANGQIEPLWDVFVGGERSLAGQASVQGRLGGTLADPRITGQAHVEDGTFIDGATGLAVRRAVLRATFTDDAVQVTQLSGVDGEGGQLRGSGRISLLRNGASSFKLTLQDFQLIDNEMAAASVSGQATMQRAADGKMRIAGRLTITGAEVSPEPLGPPGVVSIPVTEINVPEHLERRTAPARPGGPAIALDVELDAPRRVYVRGRGLDVELAVDAHVGGTTADPQLTGTARVVRGDYEFAGKRFIFDRQGVIYLSTEPERIRLNLTATREDPALTATIRIRGTAERPEITLSASPSLPQDEVLSQVLFGRSASQLSTLEAAQLAAGLSSLAGGGGFDILGELRGLAGLDRLALIGGEASGLAVAGGKYVSDDVYLEIIGGSRQGPAVQVEWRVSRRFSVLSRLMGEGGAHLAVRWRRDY